MSHAEIVVSRYCEAKKALNASAPERIVCRVNESNELRAYLADCFENKSAVSIYVNGQPGTGKTLCVNHVLDSLKVEYRTFILQKHKCLIFLFNLIRVISYTYEEEARSDPVTFTFG